MFRALIFDFDGVLVESVDVKTRAFKKLFAGESPKHLSQIIEYHLLNGGVSRFVKFRHIYSHILGKPLTEAHFTRLCDEFAKLVIDEVVSSPWVSGAQEFLNAHKSKYEYHIVTGTPQTEMEQILKSRGIRNFFRHVFGSPRPKESLLKELLAVTKLASHHVAYIGDAPNDWAAAQKVGVPFIWRKGPSGVDQLENFSGPWLSSLESLDQCLGKLAKRTSHAHPPQKKPILAISKRNSTG